MPNPFGFMVKSLFLKYNSPQNQGFGIIYKQMMGVADFLSCNHPFIFSHLKKYDSLNDNTAINNLTALFTDSKHCL